MSDSDASSRGPRRRRRRAAGPSATASRRRPTDVPRGQNLPQRHGPAAQVHELLGNSQVLLALTGADLGGLGRAVMRQIKAGASGEQVPTLQDVLATELREEMAGVGSAGPTEMAAGTETQDADALAELWQRHDARIHPRLGETADLDPQHDEAGGAIEGLRQSTLESPGQ